MSKPWEKYGATPTTAKPWERYGSAPTPPATEKRPPPPVILAGAGQALGDLARGAGAGLASTVFQGGDIIRRGLGMERVIDRPEVQELMTAPDSMAGTIGKYGEQALEFAVPLSKLTKATTGMNLIKRMGVEALGGAGVAGIQSGGDPAAMTLGAAFGGVVPAVGAGLRGGGALVKRAAEGAGEGGIGGAVANVVRKASTMDPVDTMFRAIKPRNVKTNFRQSLTEALPELKASEAALGKPIETVDDLLAATKDAKARIWKAREEVLGPARAMGAKVDGNAIADAMERSISKKMRLESPELAQKIADRAASYRKKFDLADAEEFWHDTNSELEAFYNKFPQSQRSALAKDPEAAILNAQGEAWRNAIEGALGESGQGPGARELARRYGKLMEVEGELRRRANVAARQQPESLSEQMGAWQGAGDIAKGAWAVTRGDLKGLADIASGHAKREGAKFLKEQQTTDALIRRSMAAVKGAPRPYPKYTPPKVAGLLEAGPVRMPGGPDATKMTVTTGPPLQPPPPKTGTLRGLLEAGPRRMPPAPDSSGVRAVPAKSTVVRDPKTGKFKRVYTSEGKAMK